MVIVSSEPTQSQSLPDPAAEHLDLGPVNRPTRMANEVSSTPTAEKVGSAHCLTSKRPTLTNSSPVLSCKTTEVVRPSGRYGDL